MAENESNTNPSSFFNIFRISLTREQQIALTHLLPRGYSFQPYKCTRSLDEESLRSESLKPPKKKKELKDPDYAIPYINKVKEAPVVKVDSTQAIPGGEAFLQCYIILKKLKKSIYSWPFKTPVDPKALGIPEYLNVVLEPMDLKTIEDTLRREGYAHPSEFHRDIYKVLMNSYKFNQKSSEVFATTVEFEEEYLRLVKDAKDGKLVLERKIKIEGGGSLEQETPSLPKEKPSSVEPHKPRPYNKKIKTEKPPEEKQKEKEEKVKVKEKEKEKQKQKQKQKEKEKEKEKQKQREKEAKVKLEQIERHEQQPEHQIPSFSQLFQDFKTKQEDHLDFSQIYQPKEKSVMVKEEQDLSVSNEPIKKKEGRPRQKKPREKGEMTESLKEIKELKEVTQVENEKNVVLMSIQRKLTDLLRRLNQFQFNKPKAKPAKPEGSEHPNFNNFSSVTTAEKKKLAERISLLPPTELKYIIDICFRSKRDKRREEEGYYDIDLEKADPKTLKQLSNFVAMRTKQSKRGPKSKNDPNKRPPSQAAPEEQEEPEQEFRFEEEEAEAEEESQSERSGVGELLLEHPCDDIHSHMMQQNFQFSVGELLEIDDNSRNNDQYHPDEDNYQF